MADIDKALPNVETETITVPAETKKSLELEQETIGVTQVNEDDVKVTEEQDDGSVDNKF